MHESITPKLTVEETEDIQPIILESIQTILNNVNVRKIYFIDDAINQDTGKETFKALIQNIVNSGKIGDLRSITIQGINFNIEQDVLLDHIEQVWQDIKHSKQLRYFEQAYKIAGTPEAINDLNVSNNLKDFFKSDQIEFLSPNDWDIKKNAILESIKDEEKIILLFDQDLKLATGRYSEQSIKGEHLILELKEMGFEGKTIISLLTHTITSYSEELPERKKIRQRISTLTDADFFVLAKVRLEKPALFADGIKKVCLNTYCENIKKQTSDIIKQAQASTLEMIENFDTYDFDHTVFKSSYVEGVWEPDTLLRIADVIFKDEVKKIMIEKDYLSMTNPAICAANEISRIEIKISDGKFPYDERYKLRHKEIYEDGLLLNSLRRPIDNGDIFIITEGEKKGKKFILVAQECDLMVRGETGERNTRSAVLLEIESLSDHQLYKSMKGKYEGEIKKGKFSNHFFADKYKLEYFDSGTNNNGLVYFSKSILIDLNVLDLIVFNETGEASIDLSKISYNKNHHNEAWRNRFNLLKEEFILNQVTLDDQYNAVEQLSDKSLTSSIKAKLNHLFSFVTKAGIQNNYSENKYQFGIKRILRLRQPKAKYLLDRYYQHLSRTAEPHDFAQ